MSNEHVKLNNDDDGDMGQEMSTIFILNINDLLIKNLLRFKTNVMHYKIESFISYLFPFKDYLILYLFFFVCLQFSLEFEISLKLYICKYIQIYIKKKILQFPRDKQKQYSIISFTL